MVPLEVFSDVGTISDSEAELRLLKEFLYGERVDFSSVIKSHYVDLIRALRADRASEFNRILESYETRKPSESSTWCYDDALIFLLLLGIKKYKIDTNLISKMLEVRKSLSSGMGITQTFGDINEDSFSIDLPYDFVKTVFLQMMSGQQLDRESAHKCYSYLTATGFLESLTPFLRLLALRSYELILFKREPKQYETIEDAITALSKAREDLSIKHLWGIWMILPFKATLFVITALLVIVPWLYNHWGILISYCRRLVMSPIP